MDPRHWDEHRTGRLAALYGDGMPFRGIAAEIGVSRSAVIGKVHRMGLEPRIGVIARARPCSMVKVSHWDPIQRDFRCTIIELTDRTCRYPLWPMEAGENERWYCGRPSACLSEGRPYCKRHSELSSQAR